METKNSKYQFLDRFAANLNEQAATGKLDPVIGRDDEIRHILQILFHFIRADAEIKNVVGYAEKLQIRVVRKNGKRPFRTGTSTAASPRRT